MSVPPADHDVVITVADETRADLDSLVQKLSAKGLTNASALPSVGIITGKAASHAIDGLRAEPGVSALELSGDVQIPPPDSEVQ
jgi:hypothetical protein